MGTPLRCDTVCRFSRRKLELGTLYNAIRCIDFPSVMEMGNHLLFDTVYRQQTLPWDTVYPLRCDTVYRFSVGNENGEPPSM